MNFERPEVLYLLLVANLVLETLARQKLLPVRSPSHAFLFGLIWGWLPCGLVYAELAVATASGGPITGALVMGSFGVGTAVSLSAVSVLLHSLGIAKMPRQASGALLILFSIWTVLPFLQGSGSAH